MVFELFGFWLIKYQAFRTAEIPPPWVKDLDQNINQLLKKNELMFLKWIYKLLSGERTLNAIKITGIIHFTEIKWFPILFVKNYRGNKN